MNHYQDNQYFDILSFDLDDIPFSDMDYNNNDNTGIPSCSGFGSPGIWPVAPENFGRGDDEEVDRLIEEMLPYELVNGSYGEDGMLEPSYANMVEMQHHHHRHQTNMHTLGEHSSPDLYLLQEHPVVQYRPILTETVTQPPSPPLMEMSVAPVDVTVAGEVYDPIRALAADQMRAGIETGEEQTPYDPILALAGDMERTEIQTDKTEVLEREIVRSKRPPRPRNAEKHNLAERNRRRKINDRLNILQDLIPFCTKTDTASMLDDAMRYLRSLESIRETMSNDVLITQDSYGDQTRVTMAECMQSIVENQHFIDFLQQRRLQNQMMIQLPDGSSSNWGVENPENYPSG